MGLTTDWHCFQRLVALGRAGVETDNISRFALAGLVGATIDLLLFHLLMGLGLDLVSAHIASFVAAAIGTFILHSRWSITRTFRQHESLAACFGRCLLVMLMALAMRGGVLAGLVYGLGLSPSLSILPAVAVSAIIFYLGSMSYVFPARDRRPAAIIRWRLAALTVIVYVFILRLVYLGSIDLIPDEMYYWTWWNLHPDFSYLDHPRWWIG
jgi:dolichol-phosphate mannosyltransferase